MPIVTGDLLDSDGILKADPLANTDSKITTVLITNPEYSSTFVDLKWTPRVNLLTHIEGSSWTVDYYSQVIDKSSNLSGQQYSKNPVYQSYKLIRNMEMKVTSPLSTSQEADTKGMTVTGTALLYPFIIPNEGDMFVADIGEGKLAVFRITDSIKKSILKESCYEISYGLQNDNNNGSIVDLNEKVIETVYYQKDMLTYGQSPLLISQDNDALINLEKAYFTLLQQYFFKFFSNEFKTLIVPGQEYSIYDHFLVKYMLSEFSVRDTEAIKYVRRLNVDDDPYMRYESLWDALKYKDMSFLNTSFYKSGLVNTRLFTADPMLNGIRYTGIEKIVYPNLPGQDTGKLLSIDTLKPSPMNTATSNEMIRAINLRGTEQTVLESIYTVTVDDYYVLSQNFYEKTTSMSVLESCVWNYLTETKADPNQLLDTAKTYFKWGVLEQFYYIPIILTLIRSTIRRL